MWLAWTALKASARRTGQSADVRKPIGVSFDPGATCEDVLKKDLVFRSSTFSGEFAVRLRLHHFFTIRCRRRL